MTSLIFVLASLLTALTAQGNRSVIVVSYSGADAVGLIDPADGRELARIQVPPNPHEITLTRDRKVAWIATPGRRPQPGVPASGPNVVVGIDLDARKARPPVDLGPHASPHDLRVSSDGRTAWAACAPSQTVVEVDTMGSKIARVWKTGSEGGYFVAVTPDGRKLYVPHLEGKRVTVVDRDSGQVRTVYESGAQSGIDMAPGGREVWVIDHERSQINVIDVASDTVVARIAMPAADFGRLRFTPDGSRVVAVQGKKLLVIDARARRVAGEMELPFDMKVPDVSPDGDRAVVSHPEDDRISIVDLKALRVAATYQVGKAPDGVAWAR